MTKLNDTLQTTLFAILRSALGIEKMAAPLSLGAKQWERLYKTAVQQQVAALVFNELKTVGSDMPSGLRSQWQAYSDFCAKRFETQLLALTQLSAILEAENVRMMVLKGVGLALNYPQPQLRECGDIDIFCYDDYDKVNELVLRDLDKNARETEEKHFGFELCGIEVENHRKFCSGTNRARTYIGNVLMEMSTDTPIEDSRLPGILFPSVQMGALHLMIHTLSHLAWSGITLRHLCDITMYLRRYKQQIDFKALNSVMETAGTEKSTAVLLDICNNYLGLGLDLSGWKQYEKDAAAESVLHSIFHPFLNSCFTRDPLRKFYRKVVMHRFRSRLHRIVYGEKYPVRFLESFVCLYARSQNRPKPRRKFFPSTAFGTQSQI